MTSTDQFNLWLAAPENDQLEFKEAKNRYDFEELVNYCVALANEGGGRIILGVTDQRPRHVVGSQAFPNLERTQQGLVERLHLRIEVEEFRHPHGRVLIFHTPARPIGMPIQYRGAELLVDGSLNYAALILFGPRSALGKHLAQSEVYDNREQGSPLADLAQVLPSLSERRVPA